MPFEENRRMAEINHHRLEPSIAIGKAGMTEAVIRKVKELLKRKKVIKVKFLPSAIASDKKELTDKLAKETNSRIVHRVGFIVVLERIK